jgi:hypothetical protein
MRQWRRGHLIEHGSAVVVLIILLVLFIILVVVLVSSLLLLRFVSFILLLPAKRSGLWFRDILVRDPGIRASNQLIRILLFSSLTLKTST